MSYVLIVESPAKAKTMQKYLGKDATVLASFGHVRDLLAKKGAVDPDHDFAMNYVPIEKNAKHVDAIKKALKTADHLYLATDPDREGEAIAWHLYELLKQDKKLASKQVDRIVFHEITKTAVQEALKHPRKISMPLVNAQQARRALDYLVGFQLSPLLWKKIRRGLSAGRVQSPALRLIVEREEEIERFKTQEYWSIHADCVSKKKHFSAKLTHYENKKCEQFSYTNEHDAHEVRDTILKKANGKITVTNIEKKQRKKQPSAPFITSTLQQEAIRKLGFTAQKAMRIAQQLYEGVEIAGESVGLITYMRTDSVQLAQEAIIEIRDYITRHYGDSELPKSPRVFKTKSKNAQEAHEAIRPTSIRRSPTQLTQVLSKDQLRLYTLIWKRALASQMMHALIDTVAADLTCHADDVFRATGSTVAKPGFLAVYEESRDDAAASEKDTERLPELSVGDVLDLSDIIADQHFTEPPPRFNEATLVKALEEFGIGRPSTYASIIQTIQQRNYVNLEQKRFYPTDVGRIVNKFLTEHFARYVDYGFTANLEDDLDAVARDEKEWVPLLNEFWKPFDALIADVGERVQRKDVTQEKLDEACPKCGKELSIRLGRNGRFIGCTGYPDCDYTRSLEKDGESAETTPETLDRNCPKCDAPLVMKQGRYGAFIGCSQYPKCRHIESLNKPEDTGISCPECKKGSMLKRLSRYKKVFYSCSCYPDCKYAVWYQPVSETCPKCSWPILTLKIGKRKQEKACPQKECGYTEPLST